MLLILSLIYCVAFGNFCSVLHFPCFRDENDIFLALWGIVRFHLLILIEAFEHIMQNAVNWFLALSVANEIELIFYNFVDLFYKK